MPATPEIVEFVGQEYRWESHTHATAGNYPNARLHEIKTHLTEQADAAALAGILGPLLGDLVAVWEVEIAKRCHQFSVGQWISVAPRGGSARDCIVLEITERIGREEFATKLTLGVS